MANVRSNIVCSLLSLAGTAGLVAIADPAAATPFAEERSVSVRYDDLDLSTSTGRATFERRIRGAASSVCGPAATGTRINDGRCRDTALARARRDAGLAS